VRGIEQFGIVLFLALAILALAMWLRGALGGNGSAAPLAPELPPEP